MYCGERETILGRDIPVTVAKSETIFINKPASSCWFPHFAGQYQDGSTYPTQEDLLPMKYFRSLRMCHPSVNTIPLRIPLGCVVWVCGTPGQMKDQYLFRHSSAFIQVDRVEYTAKRPCPITSALTHGSEDSLVEGVTMDKGTSNFSGYAVGSGHIFKGRISFTARIVHRFRSIHLSNGYQRTRSLYRVAASAFGN